jgi:hypothetical protein
LRESCTHGGADEIGDCRARCCGRIAPRAVVAAGHSDLHDAIAYRHVVTLRERARGM